LKEISQKPVGQKFDYAGAILYCIGLATILVGLAIGNPLSERNIIIIACGLAFFHGCYLRRITNKIPDTRPDTFPR